MQRDRSCCLNSHRAVVGCSFWWRSWQVTDGLRSALIFRSAPACRVSKSRARRFCKYVPHETLTDLINSTAYIAVGITRRIAATLPRAASQQPVQVVPRFRIPLTELTRASRLARSLVHASRRPAHGHPTGQAKVGRNSVRSVPASH